MSPRHAGVAVVAMRLGLKVGAGKKKQAKDPWWKTRIEKSIVMWRGHFSKVEEIPKPTRDTATPTDFSISKSNAADHAPRSTTMVLETPGLNLLISGGGFKQPTVHVEDYQYMSTLDILESTGEGMKCKFQGVIVACDKEPREIQVSENSPKKV